MLSNKSENRYYVEIDYTTTFVRVSCKRGTETESLQYIHAPTFIEKLVGTSLITNTRRQVKRAQDRCDRLNKTLDDMKMVCEEAEKEITSPTMG